MDIVQDYALLGLRALHDAEPYTRPVRHFLAQFRAQLTPVLLPLLNRAAALAHEAPAILSLGVLLLGVLVAMQILAFCRRLLLFWTRVVFRLAFWGAVGLLASLVWQRGLERSVGDALRWGGELRVVWWREYRRWEEYGLQGANAAGQGRGGGPGEGWNGGRAAAGGSWR